MKLSYIFILLIILLPILVFFFTRGVITHDEGYILHSAEKLIRGYLPYRDFSFVYTPLSIYITALGFQLFGTSILSSRIVMLFIALLSSYLIFKIVLKSTNNKLYATLSVLVFVAWGPSHINFSWPVMFAISTALAFAFFILKFIETRNANYIAFAGVSAFLVFLSKQNFGLAIFIPVIVFFSVKHARRIPYFINFFIGYSWSFIAMCIYLLQTGSFAPFINDFYRFTIQRIILNESLTTSFVYRDEPVPMILRTFLYLYPLIISIASFILLVIRRRFHLLFLPVLIGIFYIVGIRPTTDYVHLVPLLALTGIPMSLFIRFNISSTLRLLILLIFILLTIAGFYTALFKGYYRWDTPLITHTNYYQQRGYIFLNDKFFNEFVELRKIVDKFTYPNDFIFVNSYNPMIYFITERREPVKNNILLTEIDSNQYYDEVEGNIAAKKVKILLFDHTSLEALPIKNYVKEHYYFYKTVQDFDIYIRKP